jgi:hypothetical protein
MDGFTRLYTALHHKWGQKPECLMVIYAIPKRNGAVSYHFLRLGCQYCFSNLI